VLLGQALKDVPGDLLQELTEETADSYHSHTLRFCLARQGSGYPEPNGGVYCNDLKPTSGF
jgi:hypothetical protein